MSCSDPRTKTLAAFAAGVTILQYLGKPRPQNMSVFALGITTTSASMTFLSRRDNDLRNAPKKLIKNVSLLDSTTRQESLLGPSVGKAL
jgi:hypothetical protein